MMCFSYTLDEIAEMTGLSAHPDAGSVPITGISTDSRSLQPGDLFFALSGENHDGNRFVGDAFARGASAAITTIAHEAGPCLVHPAPLQALQRLAALHRERCTAQVIAITGSCGKTTAKDMAAALLGSKYSVIKTQGNLNNDIGCPLSLLRITPETHYAVIELGANHPGEIAFLCGIARPDESAVTMVAPAHLEGFGTIEQVARAKEEIVEGLGPKGCFYVNADDPRCVAMAERYEGNKIFFGSRGDVVLKSLQFNESGEMVLFIQPGGKLRLPLAVRAHSTNVLLAAAIGLRHGITELEGPLREACSNASRFKVLHLSGFTVLDDAYNANPASMKAALEALSEYPGKRKIAVLGSMFELGAESGALHGEVGAAAARYGIDRLLAMGPDAGHMVSAARAGGIAEAEVFESHEAIVETLRAHVAPGDVILIKGSRGMKMESVIRLLSATPAPGE